MTTGVRSTLLTALVLASSAVTAAAQDSVRLRTGVNNHFLAATAGIAPYPAYVGVEEARYGGDHENMRYRWSFERTTTGALRIRHTASGWYLSGAGDEPRIEPGGSQARFEWTPEPRTRSGPRGTVTAYALKNRASGRYLVGAGSWGMRASVENQYSLDWYVMGDGFEVVSIDLPRPERAGIPTVPRGQPLRGTIEGWYKLQTSMSTDLCLRGGSPERGPAHMGSCENVTDRYWKLTFLGADGRGAWYKLQTWEQEEHDRCLEGNDPDRTLGWNGAAFMDACGNYSGQSWMLLSEGNGLFRLQTAWLVNDGFDKCLEGNARVQGAAHGGNSFLAPCGNFSGQYWRLVPW